MFGIASLSTEADFFFPSLKEANYNKKNHLKYGDNNLSTIKFFF